MSQQKEVVLSGIRATGDLHLGNYLGAVRHFVELSQDESRQCLFFVADLHTLTTLPDPEQITKNVPEIILDYIAAGIDYKRSIVFLQSSIPETSELYWLLCNLMPVGDLLRCPSFKDKKEKQSDNVNAGLLNYPVLMAADILGPRANLVPVGEDQLPHLEMARSLARRFNERFGNLFPEPQPLKSGSIRVPGLDGSTKMGKSEGNTINLTDSPQLIRKKVMSAVTDTGFVSGQPMSQPVQNLFNLLDLIAPNETWKELYDHYLRGEKMYGDLKRAISDHVIALLKPFQERRKEVEKDYQLVNNVLTEGAERARSIIVPTVREAQKRMGVAQIRTDR